MIFRKKKDGSDLDDADLTAEVDGVTDEESDEGSDQAEPEPFDRVDGPFDVSEVDEPDAMIAERIDFGAVQVPLIDGLEIRLELDQESNEPMALTLVRGQGAVQVRAFAGPKTGGGWEMVREDLRNQIAQDNGALDESQGPFGIEMAAAISGQDEQGQDVVQPIRFVGVDGPRWLLQGVFFGEGTDPDRAADLEEVFRSLVVSRGETAMPVGQMLPLTLPEQVPGQVEETTPGDEVDEPA